MGPEVRNLPLIAGDDQIVVVYSVATMNPVSCNLRNVCCEIGTPLAIKWPESTHLSHSELNTLAVSTFYMMRSVCIYTCTA